MWTKSTNSNKWLGMATRFLKDFWQNCSLERIAIYKGPTPPVPWNHSISIWLAEKWVHLFHNESITRNFPIHFFPLINPNDLHQSFFSRAFYEHPINWHNPRTFLSDEIQCSLHNIRKCSCFVEWKNLITLFDWFHLRNDSQRQKIFIIHSFPMNLGKSYQWQRTK